MLNIIYDFGLVLAFFIVFKMYDIYIATMTIIVGALFQLVVTRVHRGSFDKKQLIIFLILCLFGGMTLYFHDPIFIKWKPTIVFWLLGTIFLVTHFFGEKNLTQRMLAKALEGKSEIPPTIWKKLNLAWASFFVLLGGVNVLVAYYCSTDTWVNFKLYGVFGSLLLFGFLQSLFLTKYISSENNS